MKPTTLSFVVVAAIGLVSHASLSAEKSTTSVKVEENRDSREIVVTVGLIEIPASTSYSHH